MNERLVKVFARIFKIPESEIKESISRDNTVEWDSLNHLMLLTEVEKEFEIKFTASDTLKMKSFRDIGNFLKQKGF